MFYPVVVVTNNKHPVILPKSFTLISLCVLAPLRDKIFLHISQKILDF